MEKYHHPNPTTFITHYYFNFFSYSNQFKSIPKLSLIRNQFNTTPTFTTQNQWNPSVESDFDMSNAPGPSSQTGAKVNNHQKASERMSEDESKLKILLI